MKKAYRRALLFVAVTFFLGAAPLMVYYALGYRFDITAAEPLPVGVILIDTNPRRATAIVNDRQYGTTPRAVSNLPPGPAHVTITKDGYDPWHKTVDVNPAAITELRSVRLFPTEPTRRTIASHIDHFSISPNRSFIAALRPAAELSIIDTENGLPIVPLIQLAATPDQLLWSPDSNRLLAITTNQVYLIDITEQRPIARPLPALAQTKNLTWDQRVPGRLLALTNHGALIAYHLDTRQSTQLSGSVTTFATSSRHIYVATTDQRLNVYNIQGDRIDSSLIAPDKQIDTLLITPGGHVALTFTDQSLAVLNEQGQLVTVAPSILEAGWSPDERLLYVQPEETSLQVYNLDDERIQHIAPGELKQIIRLSRPIRAPQWFAGGRHLIYQLDDQIIISEIDTRDHPVAYTVDSTNRGDSQITVGHAGQEVFYLTRSGDTAQLIQTSLITQSETLFDFIN